ncbi:uncharacterized protein SCHCODRAFT_02603924 [Schizophyllum commune H4-8]|uniref:uncharacterized protein n=1 Tax=Schizophyllum commune (strain H4-8 / FGSC 9210) TaxID=578458 RepID=UPI00216063AC|nr:uncharacterized protein SCHCODRAFT_02603924 [Schizophyllum commune H4-8]KAI5898998.1 hypothetical protein SCHCODRAFT_02603924 [Schizophyllum commune H4-8]
MAPLRASAEHRRSGSRRLSREDRRQPTKQASDDSLRTSSDDIPWASSDDAPWTDNDVTPKPYTTYPDASPLTATNYDRARGLERIPGSYEGVYPPRGGRLAHIRHTVWPQVKGIVVESAPTLLLTTLGLLLTGELLDRTARFPAMQRVDQLIMIIPVVLNLKGNLEMNLSARLGTAANTGLLDDGVDDERNVVSLNDEDDGAPHRSSSPHPHLPPSSPSPRRQIITGNLALLQAQAAVVSFVAACVSIGLGMVVPRGEGEAGEGGSMTTPATTSPVSAATTPPVAAATSTARSLVARALRRRRPLPAALKTAGRTSGLPTFIFLAATATASAALSALLLGAFMCALVVACRRFNLDPDNIAPPVAACLGDLVTLVLVGVVSGVLLPAFVGGGGGVSGGGEGAIGTEGTIGTQGGRGGSEGGGGGGGAGGGTEGGGVSARAFAPRLFGLPVIPLLVFATVIAIAVFCLFGIVRRNRYVRPLLREGWAPLFGAMVISSGTGIVLDLFVSRYEDFAVLAVVISGLPGSVGSIFTSRLSTELHAGAGREQHERGVGEEGRGLLADEGRGLLADEEDGTPLTAPLTKPSHRRTPSSSHARSPSTASFHRQSSHYPPTPGAPSPHHMSTPHHARPAPPPPPPLTVAITLLLITLPVELIFLAVVRGLGWLELPLLFVGCSVVFFCVAVTISLLVAYHLTKFLWSRGLDPDSNALPLHSSLMDLVGQLLLVLCFELVSLMGVVVETRAR